MSAIYTSYLRIKKRDNQHLTSDEIDYLFNSIVNVHGDFGSYWVRIVKKYRPSSRCLDIQFGSTKREENICCLPDVFNKYYIVERINYEGSLDRIFEYEKREEDDFAKQAQSRLCKYAFDRILITSDENWLKKEGAEWTSSNTQELVIDGSYYASNCKSYIDLYEDSEYYGTLIDYTEDYPYDYFVLTETEKVEFINPPFLEKLSSTHFEAMPDFSKLEFLHKYRKVMSIRKTVADEVEILAADHWDNCIDEKYLETNRKIKHETNT